MFDRLRGFFVQLLTELTVILGDCVVILPPSGPYGTGRSGDRRDGPAGESGSRSYKIRSLQDHSPAEIALRYGWDQEPRSYNIRSCGIGARRHSSAFMRSDDPRWRHTSAIASPPPRRGGMLEICVPSLYLQLR